MPKRSNDFQRLVYLVRLNLAEGATVTESKMMRDRLTKRRREVDVVIEGKVGSQRVVVSVECRDHKRVADVTWVDTMKSKHDRLDTNALLLASARGFTREARDVAEKYGIELVTLENQESPELVEKLTPNGSLWHKTVSISADKVRVRVAAGEGFPAEVVVTSPDNLVHLKDGTELCQIQEVVTRMLKSPRTRDYVLKEGKEEHDRFEVVWESPADHEGNPLYMMKLEPRVLRPIEYISVVGPVKVAIGRFGMRHGQLGSVRVAWGKAVIAGRDAIAVATLTEKGESKLSLNFKGTS